MAKRQKRFEVLAERAINQDGFIKEWIDVGLVAMDSPNDPVPSIKIENGKVVCGVPQHTFVVAHMQQAVVALVVLNAFLPQFVAGLLVELEAIVRAVVGPMTL